MGLMALVTSTGNANSVQLRLMQFQALPVPFNCAINPHTALSIMLLTIPWLILVHYLFHRRRDRIWWFPEQCSLSCWSVWGRGGLSHWSCACVDGDWDAHAMAQEERGEEGTEETTW